VKQLLLYATLSQGPRATPALVGTVPLDTAMADLEMAVKGFLRGPMGCMHLVIMKDYDSDPDREV